MLLNFLRRDASLNNVVAFVDGFDVLAQRGPGAALAGWAHVGSPDILFGSESYCFPLRRGQTPSLYCRRTVQTLRVGDKLVCLGKARRLYAELGVDVARRCAKLTGTASKESIFLPKPGERIVFPFLNSGLYLGRRGPLVKLIETYLKTYAQNPALAGLTDQAIFHELAATGLALATDREGHVFLNACCPRGALLRGLAAWNTSAEAYDLPAARAAPAFLHWNGHVGGMDATRAMLMSTHARMRAPRPCPGVVRVLGAQGVAEDYQRNCGEPKGPNFFIRD